MGFIQPIILGLVQGLGEFLPISSSGHLIITSWLLKWQDQGLAFDVALHWGTLVAVLIYFRKDILQLASSFLASLIPSKRNFASDPHQRMAWLVLLGTIPAAIAGKLFEEQISTVLRSPITVVITLSIGALVIFAVDRWGMKAKHMHDLTWKDALVIGLAQAIAIIPGVSRSGATMVAGLGVGLTRQQTARFSFLLSAPIILGAGVLELPAIFSHPEPTSVVVGFLAAAVFGFAAIHFLMRYIESRSFDLFAWYRLALATFILIVYLWR